MKIGTEKYHICTRCNSHEQNFRAYLRMRKLESSVLGTYNHEPRKFVAFAWYCTNCGILDTDDMISQRRRESIMKARNLRTDADFEEFMSDS